MLLVVQQGLDARARRFLRGRGEEEPLRAICAKFDGDEEEFYADRNSIAFLIKPLTKDMTVLDLCCGVGRVPKFVASHVKQYVGVDFSPTMIKTAKERYRSFPNVEFILNDGLTLKKVPDATVDIVFCELAFQHMEKRNTASYVREVHRVLKDGGVFYAQVPKFDYYKADYAFTKEETDKLFGIIVELNISYMTQDMHTI